MKLNQTREGTRLTIAVEGRIDTKTAPELEAVLTEALEGVTDLTFDFSETSYISSAGLRLLLMAQKKMNHQGTMTVKNVNDDLKEILEVTGFTEILTIV